MLGVWKIHSTCHFTAVLYVLVGNTLLLHNLCIHLSEVTTDILVSNFCTTLVTKGSAICDSFAPFPKSQQIFPKKKHRKIHQVTVGTWTTSSCVIGTGTSTVCSTCSCLKFACNAAAGKGHPQSLDGQKLFYIYSIYKKTSPFTLFLLCHAHYKLISFHQPKIPPFPHHSARA